MAWGDECVKFRWELEPLLILISIPSRTKVTMHSPHSPKNTSSPSEVAVRKGFCRLWCVILMRLFIYADVGQNNRQQQLMQFVGFWRDQTGKLPRKVAFDSTVTTYAQPQKLNELGTASSRSEFVPSRSLRRPSRPRPTGGSASTFPMRDVSPEIRVFWKNASAFRMMKSIYDRLPLPTLGTTNQPY